MLYVLVVIGSNTLCKVPNTRGPVGDDYLHRPHYKEALHTGPTYPDPVAGGPYKMPLLGNTPYVVIPTRGACLCLSVCMSFYLYIYLSLARRCSASAVQVQCRCTTPAKPPTFPRSLPRHRPLLGALMAYPWRAAG